MKKFLFIILFSFLLLFALYPLLQFFILAPQALSLSEFFQTWLSADFLLAAKNTFLYAGLTTLLSLGLGLTLAFFLTRFELPGAALLRQLFALPYFMPSFLYALAWIQLLNPTSGFLNQLLAPFLGPGFLNIYSLGGLVFVESSVLFTLAYLPLSDALLKMDQSLEEAGQIHGAEAWRYLKDITFPLLLPQLLSSALLIFATAAASFGVVALIGGPLHFMVLTTQIYQYFQSSGGEFSQGVPLSYALLLASLILMFSSSWILRRKKYYVVKGKGERQRFLSWGSADYAVSAALFLLFILIFVLPFLAVVIHALMLDPSQGFLHSPWGLKKFEFYLFSRPGTLLALQNSLLLATAVGLSSLFLGLIYAYAHKNAQSFWQKTLGPLAQLPFTAPSIVIALGLIMAFSAPPFPFYNTLFILFCAYFAKYFFVAASTLEGAWGQIHPSLEEAGLVHGASFLRVIGQLILPLLWPALISAFFMVFVPVLSELTMSTFLYGPKTPTLGVELFKLQSYEDPQGASVLSTLYLLFIMLMGGVFYGLKKMLAKAQR